MLEKLHNVCVCVACEFINSVGRALWILFFFIKNPKTGISPALQSFTWDYKWTTGTGKTGQINLGSEDGLVSGDCFLLFSVLVSD